MGNYTGTFRARDSQANSAAGVCETFNNLHDAIVGCGMTQVSTGDYAGQAGKLVTGTPGSGETQVTLGTTTGAGTTYFNVYKHPTRNVWVRMEVTDFGTVTTTSRFGRITFVLSSALTGGAFPVGQFVSIPTISSISTGNSLVTTWLSATSVSLYASCASDHFWIGSAANATTSSGSSQNAVYPDGQSTACMGFVVAASGAIVAFAGAPLELTSVIFGGNVSGQVCALRCWSREAGALSWVARPNGAIRALSDPATPSGSAGTRTQRASLYIGGVLEQFNFGTAQSAALTEGGLITVDLRGTGGESYRAMRSFGPCTHAHQLSTTSTVASLFLPWAT